MAFLVTARKYRPQRFSDVVGQEHIIKTLVNAIRSNRIAHAYLFCGPRGIGKTTTARLFAKAINCPDVREAEPCNTCDTCLQISEGRHIDVLEIDGASNRGVGEIRNLREGVHYVPTSAKNKVYIIDEVHMLTPEAFNALLKTLEEPPPHVIFILATTEPHKLPPTIMSRCQRFDFRRMRVDEIVSQLQHIAGQDGITAEEDALVTIARKADGSMRDAQSIFDQVVSFSEEGITSVAVRDVLHLVDREYFFRLTNLIKEKDTRGGFTFVEDVVSSGYDIQEFLVGVEEHLRNLFVARSTGETRLIETGEQERERYRQEAPNFPESDLLRLINIVSDAKQSVRFSGQQRIVFEIAVMKMIKMTSTVELHDLIKKLDSSPDSASADHSRRGSGSDTGSPSLFNKITEPGKGEYAPSKQASFPASASMQGSGEPVPGNIAERWAQFAKNVQSKRTLGLNLGLCKPVTVKGDNLNIACNDEFCMQQLSQEYELIRKQFQDYFGIRLIPRFHVSTDTRQSAATLSSSSDPPHPIVKTIIDELDAELLP
ncbi:MAG: DNA polymerase III subunit gamma/tau [Chlorobi bacterium]|nr:DNA polymerase III subunit gamma/tau [Chlorobiota bacterium]